MHIMKEFRKFRLHFSHDILNFPLNCFKAFQVKKCVCKINSKFPHAGKFYARFTAIILAGLLARADDLKLMIARQAQHSTAGRCFATSLPSTFHILLLLHLLFYFLCLSPLLSLFVDEIFAYFKTDFCTKFKYFFCL